MKPLSAHHVALPEDPPLETAGLTDPVAAAEANARGFANSRPGHVAAILRFGWFYGPGSDQTAGLIDAARSDVGPTCGPRDHWIGSLTSRTRRQRWSLR